MNHEQRHWTKRLECSIPWNINMAESKTDQVTYRRVSYRVLTGHRRQFKLLTNARTAPLKKIEFMNLRLGASVLLPAKGIFRQELNCPNIGYISQSNKWFLSYSDADYTKWVWHMKFKRTRITSRPKRAQTATWVMPRRNTCPEWVLRTSRYSG